MVSETLDEKDTVSSTSTAETRTVLADVDNIDRFPELNKANNQLEKTITIAAP